MANVHNPREIIRPDIAMNLATLNNGANTPTYFRMRHYDLAWFFVFTGTLVQGASLNCQMRQKLGSGGGNIILKTAVTVTTSNTLTSSLWSRCESMTVNSGYDRVGILIDETGSQNALVGAILLRMKARYKQATLLTT